MVTTRRNPSKGLVLLYAITVFSIIAAIGLSILESGETFVGNVQTDMYVIVAQQAALSGLAYGEATIQEMLNMSTQGRFIGSSSGVPVPAWAGRRPVVGDPYTYVPLLGIKDPTNANSNPNALPITTANTEAWTYTWTTEMRGGVEVQKSRFRIELRECSMPFAPAPATPGPRPPFPLKIGCGENLYDENMLRLDFLFAGSSPFKPPINNPQAFGLQHAPDSFFMYTMRVEGEALALLNSGPANTFEVRARVVVKEPFTFKSDVPRRMFPQAFWYQDLQQGY